MHSPSYLPEHIRIQIKETIVYSLDLLKRFHSTLDHQFRFNSTSTVPPFLVRCMHNRSSPPKPIDVSIYIYIYNSVISSQILSIPRQSKASQIISVCKLLRTEIKSLGPALAQNREEEGIVPSMNSVVYTQQ